MRKICVMIILSHATLQLLYATSFRILLLKVSSVYVCVCFQRSLLLYLYLFHVAPKLIREFVIFLPRKKKSLVSMWQHRITPWKSCCDKHKRVEKKRKFYRQRSSVGDWIKLLHDWSNICDCMRAKESGKEMSPRNFCPCVASHTKCDLAAQELLYWGVFSFTESFICTNSVSFTHCSLLLNNKRPTTQRRLFYLSRYFYHRSYWDWDTKKEKKCFSTVPQISQS